jgi:CRISPR-associated endonuclease Cas3-HD
MNSVSLYARRADGRRQTLKDHSETAAAYASRAGVALGLTSLFRLCGLLHDLGKVSDDFQEYLEKDDSSLRGTVVHAPQGAVFALRRWGRECNPVAVMIAAAIASHHGRLPDLVDDRGDDFLSHTLPMRVLRIWRTWYPVLPCRLHRKRSVLASIKQPARNLKHTVGV